MYVKVTVWYFWYLLLLFLDTFDSSYFWYQLLLIRVTFVTRIYKFFVGVVLHALTDMCQITIQNKERKKESMHISFTSFYWVEKFNYFWRFFQCTISIKVGSILKSWGCGDLIWMHTKMPLIGWTIWNDVKYIMKLYRLTKSYSSENEFYWEFIGPMPEIVCFILHLYSLCFWFDLLFRIHYFSNCLYASASAPSI